MTPSTATVSPLRQRMLDDMRMRKLEPKTQAGEVLQTIAADRKHLGARIGATPVLHTWGSALTHHLTATVGLLQFFQEAAPEQP